VTLTLDQGHSKLLFDVVVKRSLVALRNVVQQQYNGEDGKFLSFRR